MLHERLAVVMVREFEDEHVVDDNLRTIPTHYHAHARPRAWGRGFRRRGDAPTTAWFAPSVGPRADAAGAEHVTAATDARMVNTPQTARRR